MAARSPNVRLQKAISRTNQRCEPNRTLPLPILTELVILRILPFRIHKYFFFQFVQLDAEMPSFRAAEAPKGPVREAERGDGGHREGSGQAQAKGPADMRPASVPDPDQGREGRSSQPEQEGTDDVAEQDCSSEAGAVPQREAPKGAGRWGGEKGNGRQGSVYEHAREGACPDAGRRQVQEQGGGVQGLFQAEEAELGVQGGAEQVHVSPDESEGCQEG